MSSESLTSVPRVDTTSNEARLQTLETGKVVDRRHKDLPRTQDQVHTQGYAKPVLMLLVAATCATATYFFGGYLLRIAKALSAGLTDLVHGIDPAIVVILVLTICVTVGPYLVLKRLLIGVRSHQESVTASADGGTPAAEPSTRPGEAGNRLQGNESASD